MTLDEYQKAAQCTAREGPLNIQMVTAALGLTGESGEFADHVKKWFAQGHTLDTGKLLKELGDVLWYVALGATAIGATLDDVAVQNIEKLKARYPNGFSTEHSINRTEK